MLTFSQAFGVLDRDVLAAPVAVVHESAAMDWPSIMQGLQRRTTRYQVGATPFLAGLAPAGTRQLGLAHPILIVAPHHGASIRSWRSAARNVAVFQ